MRDDRVFKVGEVVGVERNGEVFEATILTFALHARRNMYKIHYSGYNKRHDTWVPQRRVLQLNEETMRRINYKNIRKSAVKAAIRARLTQCQPIDQQKK